MNYQKIYDSIIQKAKSENRVKNKLIYYEAHHIIPKCLGGEGSKRQWKTNHPNIVLLTAKEHYLCHLLLCKIYPDNPKILLSFHMLCNVLSKDHQRYVPSGRVFEFIRSEMSTLRRGELNPMYGKKMSEETKKRLSELYKGKKRPEISIKLKGKKSGMLGKKHAEETKQRMSLSRSGSGNPNYGKKFSDDHIKKLSESHKNKIPGNAKRVQCLLTLRVFETTKSAANYFNVSSKVIKDWCNLNKNVRYIK